MPLTPRRKDDYPDAQDMPVGGRSSSTGGKRTPDTQNSDDTPV